MLAETFVRAEGAFPLIGVGGIDSGATAHRQDQGRRQRWCSSTPGWCFAASGWWREIKADLLAALKRGHRNSLASEWSARTPADITAESWPG